MLYFSIALIILGVIQATIGTMRLYNASEQEYEKLGADKVYTVPTNINPIPEKITKQETQKEIIYYVADDKNTALDTTKNLSQKEPQNSVANKEKSEAEKKPVKEKKVVSPVEIVVTPEKETAPKGYQETIKTVITGKYFRDTLWKFRIIIDTKRIEPRWQMYNESITLGTGMTSLPEVSKVLIHEIAHMLDIYALKKTLRKSDPSEEFYRVSWKDPATIKAWVPKTAFISGYASTNQYEDFAESFVMYIFHNTEFQKRAAENDYLKQKYNFLKTHIFGDAFLGSAYENEAIPKKIWDVTRVTLRGTNLDTIFAWVKSMNSYKS